jgi:plastocyanin
MSDQTEEVATMMVRTLVTFAVVAVLGLSACGQESRPAALGQEIRIVGTEMAFSPEALIATPGRHRVVFTNKGAVYHELAIVAPAGAVLAARSLPAGATVAFDVELDGPGTYRLLCREPGHTEAGMVGKLTVTD